MRTRIAGGLFVSHLRSETDLKSQKQKKSPLIKEDFYFLYHTCPQMLDNLTNWKITINQDT